MSQSSTIQLNGALQVSFIGGASALLAPIGANLEEDLGSWEEEEYVPFIPHLQALPSAAVSTPQTAVPDAVQPQAVAVAAVITAPPVAPEPVQVLELCERCWSAYLTDNNRVGWVLDGTEWCCSTNCANRVQCTE